MTTQTPPAAAPPHMRRGVLLLNLGSPDSTEVSDVRRYLREFLSDERVLDIPAPLRQTILNLFILPTRPKKSAEAYTKVWTEEGSPLIVTTYRVADALGERIDLPVEVGMRYGSPSTAQGVRALKNRGVEEVLVVPLYPHYAMSSYETAVAKAQQEFREIAPEIRVTVQPPFFDSPEYIDALYEVARPFIEDQESFDHLLFSYHGIPERHIRKGDPSGCFCLQYEDCCKRTHPVHSVCYRHQCYATTWALAARAGLSPSQYSVSFQSRLGSDPWLTPYTDKVLEQLPSRGVKRLVVICPAFVSDCLETIEEMGMEGKETFQDAGGKSFVYIPCLNDHPAWIRVLEGFVRDFEDDAHDVAPHATETSYDDGTARDDRAHASTQLQQN